MNVLIEQILNCRNDYVVIQLDLGFFHLLLEIDLELESDSPGVSTVYDQP